MARRFSRLHPVVGYKHEITWSNLSQDAATAPITINLVTGTQASSVTDATAAEVTVGAHVSYIYFEFHFSPQQTANANVIHWKVVFEPQGTTTTNPNVYQQIDRRLTLKRGMEMLPVNVATVFKRIFVVKIPRKYGRIGASDEINFIYQASSTQQINACGIAIYKHVE